MRDLAARGARLAAFTALACAACGSLAAAGAGPAPFVLWQGNAVLAVPVIDPAALRSGEKTTGVVSGKPLQFAQPFEVKAPSDWYGQWEEAGAGRVAWRLTVNAPGATDTNIGFSQAFLPEGCSLTLTSADGSYQVGPYTSKDNADHGQLWTPAIPGETVLIAAEMPAAVADQFVLDIGQVNSGFLDVFRQGFPGAEKQGSCNNDVVCPLADGWRDEIRSVGRFSLNGAYLCTGTLVMNRRRDYRAFFLTAAHCVNTSAEAASVVVYWNYESPTCGARSGGSLSQNQSGATLRATYAVDDFTLLELSSVPSTRFNVYYAGWDPSGAGADAVTCIHHPNGDEKSISFCSSAVQSTLIYDSTVAPGADHWRVIDWTSGTTEPGSSGSGLWNASTRRIIGQLHGGDAACGNDLSDWFAKLSGSWLGGGTSASRLRDWLDPDNAGPVGMDGAYPVPVTGGWDLSVQSTPASGAVISSSTGHGGTTDYTDTHLASGTAVNLNAASDPAGQAFQRWTVDGVAQPDTLRSITVIVSANTLAVASYTSIPVPANDSFAAAIPISGGSGTTAGSNVGASKELGEPNHAGFPGGASVWWRWTAPVDTTVTVTTFGSTFDTLLAAYTGSSLDKLTAIASNDDVSASIRQSSILFTAVAGTRYYIVVDGYGGSTGSISLHWSVASATLTYRAGANGSIAGTTPQTVEHGASGSPVTAVPASGYHFVGWSDGSTRNPRQDTNVNTDLTVTAAFAVDTYALTYAATTGGWVVGPTAQTVGYGSDGLPVTAVPAFGYLFDGWSDGSTQNPRQDTNVSTTVNVTAGFRTRKPVPASGQFLATADAAAVTSGRGLWDLTGSYATTVAGRPLAMAVVHESTGRLRGLATYTAAGATPLDLPIRGSVRGASGNVTVKASLAGADPTGTVSASWVLDLTVDTASRQLAGQIRGSVRDGRITTPVNDSVRLPIPAPMDGSWALRLEIGPARRAITGTALLMLANGAEYAFVVQGRTSGPETVLSLTGDPANPAAKAIRIRTTVTPLEGGLLKLESFAARSHGQRPVW